MARESTSTQVIRFLRDAHHGGRPAWSNFDTITTGAQYRLLHHLCEEWIARGARVLDWGAGTGHASIFLSRAGYVITGYSLDGFSFKDLVESTPYRIVPADPSEPVRLPFGNAEFDAVLSVGVLEHVRETGGNEIGSLREIHRILRPGGIFLCVHLPNVANWIEAFARVRGARGHEYRYGQAQVLEMFHTAGFQIARYGRYGALPRKLIGRVLPRRLCDSEAFSRLYDAADRLGAAILPWFVQNHYVVARAPYPDRDPA
jgi:SAM-dependent methyltransferase